MRHLIATVCVFTNHGKVGTSYFFAAFAILSVFA